MKKLPLFIFLLLATFNSKDTFSQKIEKGDSLGLPGDNLNLYAVLDLFQKSETFEIFEKDLNQEDSKINNLDLNNDDKTDYIKVIDHKTGESHAIVLQVLVNEKETQDVAVIEIDKDKDGKVIVQIVGDEELYGKDYIVEPKENDPTAKTAETTKQPETTVSDDGKTVTNTTNNYYGSANQWPIVYHVYAPAYVVYVSPWHWYSYPGWWRPWRPWYWHSYYWHHWNYNHHHHHGHYHRTNYYRAHVAHGHYGQHRSSSVTVQGHRASNTYARTYASKDRKGGDGKVKPAGVNPAYNKGDNKSDNRSDNNKGNANPGTSKGNGNKNDGKVDKPKSNRNNPSAKPNNKPSKSGGGSRANSKPRSSGKPAVKQNGGGAKRGGGGGRK